MVKWYFSVNTKNTFLRVSVDYLYQLCLWQFSICLYHSHVENRHLKWCITGEGKVNTMKSYFGKTPLMFWEDKCTAAKDNKPRYYGIRIIIYMCVAHACNPSTPEVNMHGDYVCTSVSVCACECVCRCECVCDITNSPMSMEWSPNSSQRTFLPRSSFSCQLCHSCPRHGHFTGSTSSYCILSGNWCLNRWGHQEKACSFLLVHVCLVKWLKHSTKRVQKWRANGLGSSWMTSVKTLFRFRLSAGGRG